MKNFISTTLVAVACVCAATFAMAQTHCTISSPNGTTDVVILTKDGKAYYQVEHNSIPFISTSRLGMVTMP